MTFASIYRPISGGKSENISSRLKAIANSILVRIFFSVCLLAIINRPLWTGCFVELDYILNCEMILILCFGSWNIVCKIYYLPRSLFWALWQTSPVRNTFSLYNHFKIILNLFQLPRRWRWHIPLKHQHQIPFIVLNHKTITIVTFCLKAW